MPNFTIRHAQARDSSALSECIDAAYSIYASRITDLPAVSEGISHAIENHRVWVAEIEHDIVGGIILIPHDDFMILENVAVHPKSTGLGLGRALMERAEAECLELGLHELRLSTHEDMPENVQLYTHLGWRETARSGNKVHMSTRPSFSGLLQGRGRDSLELMLPPKRHGFREKELGTRSRGTR